MVFPQLGASVVEISEVECMLVHLQIQTMKQCQSFTKENMTFIFPVFLGSDSEYCMQANKPC